MNHRYLDVAFALALTPACGIDPSAFSTNAAPSAMQAMHQALEEGEVDEEGEEDESALSAPTLARIRQTYTILKTNGALAEPQWRFNEMPPSTNRYARVQLEDDANHGVSDGYAKSALVPLDSKGEDTSHFYIMREGGVAGWEFLAGPFSLNAMTVTLNEQNAGQVVDINQGDRIAVDLPCNPASGYTWMATTNGLGQAQQAHFSTSSARAWSTTRFMWDSNALTTGQTYSIRLQYKRAGEFSAMRDMVIAVHVQ